MSVYTTLEDFAAAVGQEVGAIKEKLDGKAADLSALTTTDKSNLVAAINELRGQLLSSTSIDDASQGSATTWSSDKIVAFIDSQLSDLLAGAPDALDTLGELAAAINNNPNFATDIANLANSVRYDVEQTLDATQKEQARANIGAASTDDLGPDADFVSIFQDGLL